MFGLFPDLWSIYIRPSCRELHDQPSHGPVRSLDLVIPTLEVASVKYSLRLFFSNLMLVIFAFNTSQIARAQQATGRIIGTVTDPSGGVIPDVKVTATNVATQVSQEAKTNREGFYEIISLPIGAYDVRIAANGFREQLFEHQLLQIGQS